MARQERSAWLVSYDISDPKRLRRAAQFLERRGIRLQNSVFLGLWRHWQLETVSQGLLGILHQTKDDLRIYRIPNRGNTVLIGLGPLPEGVLLSESKLHAIFALQMNGVNWLAETLEQEMSLPAIDNENPVC